MPFVTRARDEDRPESPEALFRSLRPVDRSVRDLLLRQGDVLRAYAELPIGVPDVAVELPTGGGKTLVGLLIAEWRRRTLGQRVAYLCPNVQLARQVAAKAESYGMNVVTLVRRQADWDPADFNRFQRGQAVAIAGYHQVFNSNPRLNSAQTLILDDAHAAEDAVASNWSITTRRGELLFTALSSILRPHLPEGLARRLASDQADPLDRSEVALVPPEAVARVAGEIEAALAEYATAANDTNTYVKRMLGSAVARCLVFVSGSQILMRPLVPPTSEHPPFSGAAQRVYMSATLGAAGELERAFGIASVRRVSPSTEEGFGRRFFVMPHAALGRPDDTTRAAIAEAGRAVILSPSTAEAEAAATHLLAEDTPALTADDVEEGFEPFVNREKAALVLANRYDGIDLPDDACRLVVLSGLPAHAHLQERFIMEALGARQVLSERIRTRIQQGAGRATRNARDFAAVIVRSEQLTDFLARDEELRAFPPQLQAEIEFGFANSEEPDADLLALLRAFWAQDAEWRQADAMLSSDTSSRQRATNPAQDALAASARAEVMCWRAAFTGDLPRAVTLAQEATDKLIGGDELRPYRALWFYLASSWAWQLAATDESWVARARELQREAAGCAAPLRWTPEWLAEGQTTEPQPSDDGRARRAAAVLREMGIRGSRFDAAIEEISANMTSDSAGNFERGLESLGALLGYDSLRPQGQADPDGAWRDDVGTWIVFEAKTEERPDTPLSAETVRQAATHQQWLTNVAGWEDPETAITVIVSPKATVEASAAPLAGELRLVEPGRLRDIAARTFDALRHARAAARGMTSSELEAAIAQAFADRGLSTEAVVAELGTRRIADG